MNPTLPEAPYVYFVRLWVDPRIEAPLLEWLDAGGHVRDVIGHPGFLWARRYRLAQDADDGWHAYVMLYGLESKARLETYFANAESQARFRRERAPFEAGLRMDRMWGALQSAVAAPGAG